MSGSSIIVESSPGPDIISMLRISGVERISESFVYTLDVLSTTKNLSASNYLGQEMTFSVTLFGGTKKYYHGYISAFSGRELYPDDTSHRLYQIQLVPWSWFMNLNRNFRIFQNVNVISIIETIFNEYANKKFLNSCSGVIYPVLDYCVQYQESSLEFVTRLMQENGIYYFFTHINGEHTLVFSDNITSYIQSNTPVTEINQTSSASLNEHVSEWLDDSEYICGKSVLGDYNYLTPANVNLAARHSNTTITQPASIATHERYQYPGGFKETAEGDRLALIQMQAEEAKHTRVNASSNIKQFSTGCKFLLKNNEFGEPEKSYVIIEMNLNAYEPHSVGSGGALPEYSNTFKAQPADKLCFSHNPVNKPEITGPQTAVVVGPAGEKVYTDNQGRIKVQFHWDRLGLKNENSSCWVRVSQSWAGKNFGSIALPHVGNEVIVSFMGGDPDRPVVTGRVYNPVQNIPEDPTSHKECHITRDDFGNEIILNATDGDEHIRLHSPKNSSTVELGKKGAFWSTKGTKYEASIGNSGSFTGGSKAAAFIGTSASINAGVSLGLDLGYKASAAFTNSYSLTVGTSESVTYGSSDSHAGKTTLSTAADDYIIGAGKEVCIAASATTPGPSAIFNADTSQMCMTMGQTIMPALPTNWHLAETAHKAKRILDGVSLAAMAAAAITSFVGCLQKADNSSNTSWVIGFNVAAIALAAVGAAFAVANNIYQVAKKSGNKTINHSNPGMKIGMDLMKGVEISSQNRPIALTFGLDAAAGAEIKLGDPAAAVSIKDGVKSEISLSPEGVLLDAKTGGVTINSATGVMVDSKGAVMLESKLGIDLNAPMLTINKNFSVLK